MAVLNVRSYAVNQNVNAEKIVIKVQRESKIITVAYTESPLDITN